MIRLSEEKKKYFEEKYLERYRVQKIEKIGLIIETGEAQLDLKKLILISRY